MKRSHPFVLMTLFLFLIQTGNSQTKAFPTAYGGGAYAVGGRGGNVYHVTNLDPSGKGSFSWALAQPRPATIVFDVAGTIELNQTTNISGSNLTIAGQTAPPGGITIVPTFGRFKGQDLNNVIVRYIRIRPKKSGNDAFEIYGNSKGGHNVIFDHVSLSYGGDETISLRGRETYNITYQRMLVAEGKTGSLFGDSSFPEYSYDNSFLSSLFFNISHRTPNCSSDGRVDIINNVIHQWQYRLTLARGDTKLNHINNYYSMGLKSDIITSGGWLMLNMLEDQFEPEIYSSGNIIDKGFHEDPLADNSVLWATFPPEYLKYAPKEKFVDQPHALIGAPFQIKSAHEAYEDVVSNVGANASLNSDGSVSYYLDTQDSFYLSFMHQGEGAGHPYQMYDTVRSWFGEAMYKNFISNLSSTPLSKRPDSYDTDRDGMADEWEILEFGDLSNNGREDRDNNGYTDLEDFLNQVDKPDMTTTVRPLFNHSNHVKVFPNPTDGVVYVSSDSRIVGYLIISPSGQIETHKSIDPSLAVRISLSNEEIGFYHLLINTEKGVSAKKVMIQP